MLTNKEISKEKIVDCRRRIVKDIFEIINNANNNNSLAESKREEIIIKLFKICGITNDMIGDEDYSIKLVLFLF